MEQQLLGIEDRSLIINYMNKATHDVNIKNSTKVSGIKVMEDLIKPFLSSALRKPHSLIVASRIAAAAWNLAIAT